MEYNVENLIYDYLVLGINLDAIDRKYGLESGKTKGMLQQYDITGPANNRGRQGWAKGYYNGRYSYGFTLDHGAVVKIPVDIDLIHLFVEYKNPGEYFEDFVNRIFQDYTAEEGLEPLNEQNYLYLLSDYLGSRKRMTLPNLKGMFREGLKLKTPTHKTPRTWSNGYSTHDNRETLVHLLGLGKLLIIIVLILATISGIKFIGKSVTKVTQNLPLIPALSRTDDTVYTEDYSKLEITETEPNIRLKNWDFNKNKIKIQVIYDEHIIASADLDIGEQRECEIFSKLNPGKNRITVIYTVLEGDFTGTRLTEEYNIYCVK